MSLPISLDKVTSYRDKRMEALDAKINPQSQTPIILPQTCSLLRSATDFLKKDQPIFEKQPDICLKEPTVRPKRRRGSGQDTKELATTKICQMQIILYENIMDQPRVVLDYLLEKHPQEFQRSDKEDSILSEWIMCLTKEDRMEIEKDRTWFPNPRNIQLRHITEGLDAIYGVGVKRRLRPGQQASILGALQTFFSQCDHNPQLIGQREKSIIETILDKSDNEDLTSYPFCMRQLECHFKLMATKWRYGPKIDLKNRALERALQSGTNRGHFLDLTKTDNKLVQYLLKHSTKGDRNLKNAVNLKRSVRSPQGILRN